VAAELRAGARSSRDRKHLDEQVLAPYFRRGRILTPSSAGWDALGLTLSRLRAEGSLDLTTMPRGFVFDVLIAFSCREAGVVLITRNARDMERIRSVFRFEFVAPYPPANYRRSAHPRSAVHRTPSPVGGSFPRTKGVFPGMCMRERLV